VAFEQVVEFSERIPFSLLVALYLGFLGYQEYDFKTGDSSGLSARQKQLKVAKDLKDKARAKLNGLDEFAKKVDENKARVRALVLELQAQKEGVPEKINLPELLKVFVIESKKAGLSIDAINPHGAARKDFYVEYPIDLKVTGGYTQFLSFFEHLENLKQIVNIQKFEFSPKDKDSHLTGALELVAYSYLGTVADTMGKGVLSPTTPAGKDKPGGAPK
jgi:type IV pilus assembly protein PilO